MQRTWTLFRVGSIPVQANLSVVLLAVYMLYSTRDIAVGLFLAGVLVLSILLHELAHSGVAIAFGGSVRGIVLQLMGGVALVSRMPPKAWHETLMALAGPLCSLALGVLLLFASAWCAHEVEVPGTYFVYLEPNRWLALAGGVNVGLGCFNLVPAFPMDGGRVLRSLLEVVGLTRVRATEAAVRVGQGIALLWGVLWVVGFCFGWRVPCPEGVTGFGAFLWEVAFGADSLLLPLIVCMIWVVGRRELAYVRATSVYGEWR